MKIEALQLLNLRGFKNLPKTNFSPNINLLIGSNNSGKSTLLNSLFLIQRPNVLNRSDITIGQSNGNITVFVTGNHPGVPNNSHRLIFNLANGQRRCVSRGQSNQNTLNQIPELEPNNLIYPYLSKRKVDKYNVTVNESFVKSVTGTFKHLSLKIDRLTTYPPNEEYLKTCKDILGFVVSSQTKGQGKQAVFQVDTFTTIPLTSMGEGVPNIVGLITDLCVAKNRVFLIEEPENDIHPKALKALLNLIINKSEDNQFFISTHSNIVMKYLGGVKDSKVFHVNNSIESLGDRKLFASEISEISDNPIDRREILEDLGYDFFDFDLWKGWLFLEESSAEVIIRDHLIRWFAPKLKYKLRTFSAGSISQVETKFEDFNRLFVFLHLEPTYKNKVWVIIDSGDKEKEIIDKLKERFSPSGWKEENFGQFSEHDFEKYYPKHFEQEVNRVLSLPKSNKREKQALRKEKRLLLENVKNWIISDDKIAKEGFKESAKEVIDVLKKLNKEL